MTEHLSPAILNALVDGELTAPQLLEAQQHLADCPACTADALAQTMLKTATAKAGHRFTAPPDLQARLQRQIAGAQAAKPRANSSVSKNWAFGSWAAACAVLLLSAGVVSVQTIAHRNTLATTQYASLVTEASDQHIATLAANAPPQVLSSDRHTVKPWFQGRIPFTFNLPENLPADTTLEGANLTYIHNQPAALLLYSIGKHRVSVFIRQKTDTTDTSTEPLTEHAGFHITGFTTSDLEAIAVSDVDPARLTNLVQSIQQVQP